MNNVIDIMNPRGIPTPRYRAQRMRQDRDQDLFVDMVSRHPGRIARAHARAEERAKKMAEEAERLAFQKKLSYIFCHAAIWAIVALLAVIAL